MAGAAIENSHPRATRMQKELTGNACRFKTSKLFAVTFPQHQQGTLYSNAWALWVISPSSHHRRGVKSATIEACTRVHIVAVPTSCSHQLLIDAESYENAKE